MNVLHYNIAMKGYPSTTESCKGLINHMQNICTKILSQLETETDFEKKNRASWGLQALYGAFGEFTLVFDKLKNQFVKMLDELLNRFK